MKVVSWNVNSINSRLNKIINWIEEQQPDVILLQELKCEEAKFPFQQLAHLPYNIKMVGQKTYNGVAILSKYPIDDVITTFKDNPVAEQARYIEATMNTPNGYARFISVYVVNGADVDHQNYEIKLQFLNNLKKHIENINDRNELLIIGGDFNVAAFDIDVFDPKFCAEKLLFSTNEKHALRSLINSNLFDTYRMLNPDKSEFSWWDYRANAFANNKGMRIDYIFTNPTATNYLTKAYIDINERAKDKASDHAPVVAEF